MSIATSLFLVLNLISMHVWGYEPNLRELGKAQHDDLSAISSDKEAISLFKKKFRNPLRLKLLGTRRNQVSARGSDFQDQVERSVIRFMMNLASLELAHSLEIAAISSTNEEFAPLMMTTPPALQWVVSAKDPPESLTHMLSFATAYSTLLQSIDPVNQRPAEFESYVLAMEESYPDIRQSPSSWQTMLEEEGAETVIRHLSDFSKQGRQNDRSHASDLVSKAEQMTSSASYFTRNRLIPLFSAHLTTLIVQAQTESHEQAQVALQQLETIQNTNTQTQNLARLCGDWRWIIHNHQNHGDHKMVMSFGNSAKTGTKQPQPDKITINGDTVYLLWLFPRGRQEDSLLFSNNDSRLEGTFQNSMGPYGSISGKRIKPCRH